MQTCPTAWPGAWPRMFGAMSSDFRMSKSMHHTEGSRQQEEGAVEAKLRGQLRAERELWRSRK